MCFFSDHKAETGDTYEHSMGLLTDADEINEKGMSEEEKEKEKEKKLLEHTQKEIIKHCQHKITNIVEMINSGYMYEMGKATNSGNKLTSMNGKMYHFLYCFLLGQLFHTIQDSFSPSHCARNYVKPYAIKEFYVFSTQKCKKHIQGVMLELPLEKNQQFEQLITILKTIYKAFNLMVENINKAIKKPVLIDEYVENFEEVAIKQINACFTIHGK